ncbi:Imm21 family immunity protein [Actinacidiphila glaucinigra]|uniref:Imm21 family immunity protein n=1 Tax=Actinacidiphila glaucinigra TaxID=235986 RepID=UPI00366B865B
MDAFTRDVPAPALPAPAWVESMGGPLVAVPVSALAAWGGCTERGTVVGDGNAPDDYDRACAVDDLAGMVPVGRDGVRALVLGDLPATTCYLTTHRAFLRWGGADSEAELVAAAEVVLADPAVEWQECGTWETDGPAATPAAACPNRPPSRCLPAAGRSRPSRRRSATTPRSAWYGSCRPPPEQGRQARSSHRRTRRSAPAPVSEPHRRRRAMPPSG